MVKEIIYANEAREQLRKGINTLSDAVKVTLGPKGKNVLLDKNYSSPHATKDGVTVATNIMLDDRIENMGCSMLKDIAKKTADEAGDGTTTSIILAQSLYNNGLREIEQNKFNSIDIQKGMQKASKAIIEELYKISKPCVTEDKLYQVAAVSANGDTDLADLISHVVYETGPKGNIIVKDSQVYSTYSEFVDGIRFDAGYMSYHFNTNAEKQLIEYENPLILVSLDKISGIGPLTKFIEYAYQNKRPIIIITEEIVGEALAVIAANVNKGKLQAALVSAPGFANNRKELLEDMSIVTGSKMLGDYCGNPFHLADISSLGTCKSIRVDRNTTTFFINDNVKESIDLRIKEIEGHRALNDNDKLIRDIFNNRIASLKGRVAVINVHGFTETELKEKKDRIDDAIRASQAALEEGIVPGSGITYINAASSAIKPDLNKDEERGWSIVIESVKAVFNQVATNCGLVPEVILNNINNQLTIHKHNESNMSINEIVDMYDKTGVLAAQEAYTILVDGYNFRTDKYCNLYEQGVIDPTKVLRVALENAVSITCQLLTTEAIVKNKMTEFDLANINQPKNMVNPIYH